MPIAWSEGFSLLSLLLLFLSLVDCGLLLFERCFQTHSMNFHSYFELDLCSDLPLCFPQARDAWRTSPCP